MQKSHPEYNGKSAVIRYRGGIQGEEPFDDCMEGDPVIVSLGSGEVPYGIEEALYNMDINEIRTIVLTPDIAYGDHDPSGVQRYTRSFLADGKDLHLGDYIAWEHPVSHQMVPVKVIEEYPDALVIDFNHPLAGKTLEYTLILIDVI